ncbi:MAG: zinc-binding dehydrogenase [Rhodospirillales bacterium]|nr:zinc-binding dehydrogenase [Rhodospirillales bacterium]
MIALSDFSFRAGSAARRRRRNSPSDSAAISTACWRRRSTFQLRSSAAVRSSERETINYRTDPDWDRRVKALTGGDGCDHIVELAGTLERSIRAARIGATLSLIGVLAGARSEVTLPLVVMRNLRLQGVTVGSRDDFEDMARAIERHHIQPVIDHTFGFDAVQDAFAHFEAQRHFNKVCIRISE